MGKSRKASSRSRPRKPHQPHQPHTTVDIYMGLDPHTTQRAINAWNSGEMDEWSNPKHPDSEILDEWIARGGNVRLLS